MDKLFKPWTTLSPAPPKFQSCFLLPRVETGGQNKSNPTAWHKAHTFFNFDIWGRGCRPILSSRFEYFVHLRYMYIISDQTIATSHNLTPKCSWGREIFLIPGKARLVKYYNLARLYAHSLRYTNMAMEYVTGNRSILFLFIAVLVYREGTPFKNLEDSLSF